MIKKSRKKGYPWPASALTDNEMAILAGWRKRTKTPISELLRQAVVETDKRLAGGPSTLSNREIG